MKSKGFSNMCELLTQNNQLQVCSMELAHILLAPDQDPKVLTFAQRKFFLDGRKFTVTKKIAYRRFSVIGPRRIVFLGHTLTPIVLEDSESETNRQDYIITFIHEDFHPCDAITDSVPLIPSLFFNLKCLIITYPIGVCATDVLVRQLESVL